SAAIRKRADAVCGWNRSQWRWQCDKRSAGDQQSKCAGELGRLLEFHFLEFHFGCNVANWYHGFERQSGESCGRAVPCERVAQNWRGGTEYSAWSKTEPARS